jgi:uncharacterized protein YggL (DUF469 family)
LFTRELLILTKRKRSSSKIRRKNKKMEKNTLFWLIFLVQILLKICTSVI